MGSEMCIRDSKYTDPDQVRETFEQVSSQIDQEIYDASQKKEDF